MDEETVSEFWWIDFDNKPETEKEEQRQSVTGAATKVINRFVEANHRK